MRHLLPILLLALVACGEDPAPAPPAPPPGDWTAVTKSGIRYKVLVAGQEGDPAQSGDEVTVHYVGTFPGGRKFDSSRDRGEPFRFKLGARQVIAGWDEVVALMTEGAKWNVHIPWKLAYGEAGRGGIPPKADLQFEIELLGVKRGVPLPKFREGNKAAQKRTESGLVYEEIRKGSGDPPRKDQGVSLRFAFWSTEGHLVFCSEMAGQHLAGACSNVTIGPLPLPWLREAPQLMAPGAVMRFEVPASLGWGDKQVDASLPPGATTVWELELLKVNDIPPFAMSDPEKTTTTASGLKIETLKEGAGNAPRASDTVTVNYTGWLTDGTLFDSGHGRGEPTTFPLGGVIAGWTEGLQLMKVGGSARLTIPGHLAYGPRGQGEIPPNATLVFVIELLKIG